MKNKPLLDLGPDPEPPSDTEDYYSSPPDPEPDDPAPETPPPLDPAITNPSPPNLALLPPGQQLLEELVRVRFSVVPALYQTVGIVNTLLAEADRALYANDEEAMVRTTRNLRGL